VAKIKQPAASWAAGVLSDNGLLEVRSSPLQGMGVFALKRIRKGTPVIEYLGERITPDESDKRYARLENPNHTFLFTVDDRLVVDATWKGNVARYINHACEPNCESVIERRRIWIKAIRNIEEGEELTYDYNLDMPGRRPKGWRELYGCRCGAASCRGTLLAPTEAELRAMERNGKNGRK
jgi:SET domain-containing protein